MGIEDGGLREVIVEDATDEEEECCPCCGGERWVRAIAAYNSGACWVLYCADCGKPLQKKWTILP